MADIKQAAKWMEMGYRVRRASTDRFWCTPWEPRGISYEVSCADGGEHTLDLFDLQADDWELAD